jgi:hypothetical protein
MLFLKTMALLETTKILHSQTCPKIEIDREFEQSLYGAFSRAPRLK